MTLTEQAQARITVRQLRRLATEVDNLLQSPLHGGRLRALAQQIEDEIRSPKRVRTDWGGQ